MNRISWKALRWLLALAVLLGIWLLMPPVAYGNATPARQLPGSGGLVAPSSTKAVRIDRERLSFDFTSSISTPRVTASYDLANISGGDVSLDLLFLAPAGDALSVSFDGAPTKVEKALKAQLPAEWMAPTVGIDPRTGEDYPLGDQGGYSAGTTAWSFSIRLAPDRRGTLTAEYEGHTGYDRKQADHILRHLAYLLGPANNWAGFGTLEVSATIPARYLLASKPALQKLGETDGTATYGATFNGIPAEMLRVSTVATPTLWTDWVGAIGFGLPFLPGVLFGVLSGVLFSRIRRWYLAFLAAGTAAFVAAMLVGIPLSMVVMGSGPLASAAEDLSDQTSITYATIFSAVLLAPFFASLLAAIWAAVGSSRRKGA